ncbi:MAG: NADP-dependent succinic semialdehyde dehydrogenase [Opitutaceae bacterium]|nr:NADP-dependent succinic semialdehyde dehydrogenase [Opitutaceae bacterium]|tara:strand:- start:6225 stop:7589 length:1365 start_codon:yes stop_codon:yes gene_type:complete
MSLISTNPATSQRIHIYGSYTSVHIEASLKQAHEAFLGWRELSPKHRAKHLKSLARSLRSQLDDLADLITTEVGKPIAQSRAEIEKCAKVCDYYARHGVAFLAKEHPSGAHRHARVLYEPLGTILAIMPWNFPFWQVFRAAIPAIMAGNTVVLKHASNVSGCALAIEQVFHDAAVPEGLLHTLLIPAENVEALINDPRIHGVTMTGSTEAGRKVAAMAGATLKPGVFELGGSDPYIILEDADLDLAAEVCAASRLTNSGQSCVSAKRFIVINKVKAAFQKKLVACMAAYNVGEPFEPNTEVGPMARHDLRDELHAQVTKSVSQGAKVLLGGEPLDQPGWYYPPTVLSRVTKGMPAYDDEMFGPVAAVIGVKNESEAIKVANDTPFGLGAAIFTKNKRHARDLAPELDVGMVFVNEAVKSDPALPFGGIKQSGYGRELGIEGIRAFVNVKTLWVE